MKERIPLLLWLSDCPPPPRHQYCRRSSGEALGLLNAGLVTHKSIGTAVIEVMEIDSGSSYSDSHVSISFVKPKYKGDHPCYDVSELCSTMQFVH